MQNQLLLLIILSVVAVYFLFLAGHVIVGGVEKIIPIGRRLPGRKIFVLYFARVLAIFISACSLLLLLAVAVKCLNYFI